MSETCKVSSERKGDVAILWTDGYINNQGGEEIAGGVRAGGGSARSS